MKLYSLKLFILSLILMSSGTIASAHEYNPLALKAVIETAYAATKAGRPTVVMFDLDDTLINTRDRNLRIFRDFVSQSAIQSAFPVETKKILTLSVNQIQYLMTDTFSALGITNPDFIKKAGDFWLPRFFSNQYCALDIPMPGAARYLQYLAKAGAKIVYLTGRDIPRMRQGTIFNLKRDLFPTTPNQDFLVMKPDATMDDLAFKESQFKEVAAHGEVIAVFENEPANINAMADAFPSAQAIFLDTIHSPKPIVPEPRVQWVRDFNFPL